jgi:hypothetical protein
MGKGGHTIDRTVRHWHDPIRKHHALPLHSMDFFMAVVEDTLKDARPRYVLHATINKANAVRQRARAPAAMLIHTACMDCGSKDFEVVCPCLKRSRISQVRECLKYMVNGCLENLTQPTG